MRYITEWRPTPACRLRRTNMSRSAAFGAAMVSLTLALPLAYGEPAIAARWVIRRAPQPAVSFSTVLKGVSCTSMSACTAVGYNLPIKAGGSNATVALVERWNGSSWAIQRTPSSLGSSLSGVSCPSRTACTAVGSGLGGNEQEVPLVERWDGRRWSIQRIQIPKGLGVPGAPAANNRFTAVSCPSRRACVAVGVENGENGTGGLVERWNGIRWSVQRIPQQVMLNGVSCSSAAACIAVGNPSVRWNGRTWKREPIPLPKAFSGYLDSNADANLTSVSCTSTTECVAVGGWNLGCDSCSTLTFAERWNGSRWSSIRARDAGLDRSLFGVSCSSSTACTAVGSEDLPGGDYVDGRLLAERWTGLDWSVQPTPNPRRSLGRLPSCLYSGCAALNGVSCTSGARCVAVGSYGDSNPVALVARHE